MKVSSPGQLFILTIGTCYHKYGCLWVLDIGYGLVSNAGLQGLAGSGGWKLSMKHGVAAKCCHMNFSNPGRILTYRITHAKLLRYRSHFFVLDFRRVA